MQTDVTVDVEADQVHQNDIQVGNEEQPAPRSVETESWKRHSEELDQRPTKKKRYSKQPARLEYRKRLNEMIFEGRRAFRECDDQLEDSQIGLTTWRAVEKEQLFINLARLGRFNLSQLTSNLPRKSEAEVKVYLDLLDEASQQFETSTEYVGPMEVYRISDPEPALEISEECCTALNRNVEILRKILFEEETAEQDAYFGTYGLLTRSLATDLEVLISNDTEQLHSKSHSDKLVPQQQQEDQSVDVMDVDERHDGTREEQNLQSQGGRNGNISNNHSQQNSQIEEGSSVATIESPQSEMLLSAVRFLDLDALLKLSEVIFMNKGPPNEDENWREISGWDPDGPTIFATAFIDLYKIVVCLTKRLASAAIFQALSRIRAIDHTSKQVTIPLVRQEDVRAALDMLDLKPKQKLHDYWRKKPREYSLQVYGMSKKADVGQILSTRKQGKASLLTPLNYDEVEWRLRPSSRRNPRMEMKDGQFELSFSHIGDNTADSTASVNQPAKAIAPAVSSTTRPQSTPFEYQKEGEDNAYEGMTKLEQAWHKYEQSVEVEAGLMDERESAKHETQLWEIAGKTPPEHIADRLEAISSRGDPPHITTKLNGVRPKPWTLALSYRAEWERYGEFLADSAFRATKKAWIQQKHERERSHLTSERPSSSAAPFIPPTAFSSSSSSPSPSPSVATPPTASRSPSADLSEHSVDLEEEGLEGDTEALAVMEARQRQRQRQQESEDDEDLDSDSGSDVDAVLETGLDPGSDY